jgi:hypothetical protein
VGVVGDPEAVTLVCVGGDLVGVGFVASQLVEGEVRVVVATLLGVEGDLG